MLSFCARFLIYGFAQLFAVDIPYTVSLMPAESMIVVAGSSLVPWDTLGFIAGDDVRLTTTILHAGFFGDFYTARIIVASAATGAGHLWDHQYSGWPVQLGACGAP